MARTLSDLFEGTGSNATVELYELSRRLEAKADESGLESLSPPALTLLLAFSYDAGMSRSGWYSLMRRGWYPTMEMIPALEAIGTTETAQVLRELASLFPSGSIPATYPERAVQFDQHVMPIEDRLDRLEERLHASDENVRDSAYRFALAHRETLAEEIVPDH